MRRLFKLALVAVEMASVPMAGYLIDIDGRALRAPASQAMALNTTEFSKESPVQFRFRIPGIGELREFIWTPRRSALFDTRAASRQSV